MYSSFIARVGNPLFFPRIHQLTDATCDNPIDNHIRCKGGVEWGGDSFTGAPLTLF